MGVTRKIKISVSTSVLNDSFSYFFPISTAVSLENFGYCRLRALMGLCLVDGVGSMVKFSTKYTVQAMVSTPCNRLTLVTHKKLAKLGWCQQFWSKNHLVHPMCSVLRGGGMF